MATPILQVDAFVLDADDSPRPGGGVVPAFSGNPAAVCLLDAQPERAWMAAIAAQLRLSETAFTWLDSEGARQLRWFTPTAEVDLCGHATLATAHVLLEQGRAERGGEQRFETRSGTLTARVHARGLALDFPSLPPDPVDVDSALADSAAQALGRAPDRLLRSRFDLLAVFADAASVRALRPDFARLSALDARGVIATAPGADCDLVSRFFAPAVGVDEDPVTGSAHCVLAPYWALLLGRAQLTARQLSERGGQLSLTLHGAPDSADARVELAGTARTIWRGELLV